MRRILIQRPGGYERLRLVEQPDPSPGPGEVVVRVRAVGVNFADVVVRMGLYKSAKTFVGWPITPGFEFSGEVLKLGQGVERWRVGDVVMGVTRFGGYASHVAVAADQLFPLPASFTLEQAAGFPVVFLTAYYALFFLAHPRPGDVLLVHSAAGGVGSALLQLGRIAGCRTIGIVGAAHKVEQARALGASVVIDKSREPLWAAIARAAPHGCDVVLDGNGAATLAGSYAHLASPGKLVTYGFHSMFPRKGGRPQWLKMARDLLKTPRFGPLQLCNDNKSVLACNLSYLFNRVDLLSEAMTRLLDWAQSGAVQPLPTTTYPLEEAARAHRDLESAQTVGKLVLLP